MCLAIPLEVKKTLKDNKAIVNSAGIEKKIDIRFVPNLKKGDWVIVHAGFAIQKIDEKDAKETLRLLNEIS
jgi:hydrogenase expression/formation protein HypC